MKIKKISTSAKVIVIIIFIITAGVLVWNIRENKSAESEMKSSYPIDKNNDFKKNIGSEISGKWIIVSHGNFWDNPNIFASHNYKFPNIKFSYPDGWDFQCCSDMDHASIHTIYSSKNHDKSLPYITITDYVLSGCPKSQDTCPLDKITKMTANEKFNRLTSAIATSDILPKIKLNNLGTTAFVYKKSEENNKLFKGYIINLRNSVIEIDFINYELLNNAFIENFLNRVFFETK